MWIRPEYEGCAGVDIGAQTMKVGAVVNGTLNKLAIPTRPVWADARAALVDAVHTLIGSPRSFGIGSPGPLDWRSGYMNGTPNIPWRGVCYKDLADDLNCEVAVDNDANVAGLAEALHGAGLYTDASGVQRMHEVVCGFTLGSGIGYFCVVNGRIFHGRVDVEGGHQILNPEGPECGCGARGCLEAYCGATLIQERYRCRLEQIDDPAFWDTYCYHLGWGIANVTAIVCPDVFLLCGGVTQREGILQPIADAAARICQIHAVPPIRISAMGVDSGLIGAVLLGTQLLDD